MSACVLNTGDVKRREEAHIFERLRCVDRSISMRTRLKAQFDYKKKKQGAHVVRVKWRRELLESAMSRPTKDHRVMARSITT